MKKAVWLVLVVPVVFLSLSKAQENAPTQRVDSFLELVTSELVRVGDHIKMSLDALHFVFDICSKRIGDVYVVPGNCNLHC